MPYAAPPTGDLRWRAPKPAAHWDGVRKADTFSPICMQGNGTNPAASEDCLYLNVWTGAKAPGEKRPVMVWIYGGGYTSGSGSQPMYDGEALAKKGVVIVTINYRLGAFGFFSYPELTTESDRRGAGNFGVMDSIAALQWVQKNIAAFGGDPKRVTVFGESAGSGLVANLMTIPQSKGLFERAIGESSAWSTVSVAPLPTLADAEAKGTKLAETLGVKSLAELRAKPAADILKGARGDGPVVDGWLIREDPSKVFAAGKQLDVPVLTGSNRDESFGANPRDAQAFIDSMRKRYRRYGRQLPEGLSGIDRRRSERIRLLCRPRRNGVRDAQLGAPRIETGKEVVRLLLHRAASAGGRQRGQGRRWSVRARPARQRRARLGDSLRVQSSGQQPRLDRSGSAGGRHDVILLGELRDDRRPERQGHGEMDAL